MMIQNHTIHQPFPIMLPRNALWQGRMCYNHIREEVMKTLNFKGAAADMLLMTQEELSQMLNHDLLVNLAHMHFHPGIQGQMPDRYLACIALSLLKSGTQYNYPALVDVFTETILAHRICKCPRDIDIAVQLMETGRHHGILIPCTAYWMEKDTSRAHQIYTHVCFKNNVWQVTVYNYGEFSEKHSRTTDGKIYPYTFELQTFQVLDYIKGLLNHRTPEEGQPIIYRNLEDIMHTIYQFGYRRLDVISCRPQVVGNCVAASHMGYLINKLDITDIHKWLQITYGEFGETMYQTLRQQFFGQINGLETKKIDTKITLMFCQWANIRTLHVAATKNTSKEIKGIIKLIKQNRFGATNLREVSFANCGLGHDYTIDILDACEDRTSVLSRLILSNNKCGRQTAEHLSKMYIRRIRTIYLDGNLDLEDHAEKIYKAVKQSVHCKWIL